MRDFFILFCITFIVMSCSEKQTVPATPYFSVPDLISQQVKGLRSSSTSLTRTVTFNDNSEAMTIRTPDWEKELKPFLECDLNLPAWKNGFAIDTNHTNGTTTVRYTAREKRITIRELTLSLRGDSVLTLSVNYLKSNTWYSLGRKLTYIPGIGYTIIIQQDTPLQAPETIRLEGRFH